MQIFKVIGNTIASVGQTIQDTASLASLIVSDDGLKHTTRQSFKIVNGALDESVAIADLEMQHNLSIFLTSLLEGVVFIAFMASVIMLFVLLSI